MALADYMRAKTVFVVLLFSHYSFTAKVSIENLSLRSLCSFFPLFSMRPQINFLRHVDVCYNTVPEGQKRNAGHQQEPTTVRRLGFSSSSRISSLRSL